MLRREKFIWTRSLRRWSVFQIRWLYYGFGFPSVKGLLRNLFAFDRKQILFNSFNKGLLYTNIGRLSYHAGDIESFKSYTREGFKLLNQHLGGQKHHSMARALAYLGLVEKIDKSYQSAQNLLERSAKRYKRFHTDQTLDLGLYLISIRNAVQKRRSV